MVSLMASHIIITIINLAPALIILELSTFHLLGILLLLSLFLLFLLPLLLLLLLPPPVEVFVLWPTLIWYYNIRGCSSIT